MAGDLTPQQLKHLEMIQSVVSRMAQNTFTLKGWTVTIVSALCAFLLKEHGSRAVLIGVPAVLCFWGLTAYYLRQERLFRALFQRAALGGLEFSLKTDPSEAPSFLRTLFARTLCPIYLVALFMLLVAGWGGFRLGPLGP